MQWFRRHIRTGSRLALFALALQFVLSFGHFHADAAQAAAALQGHASIALDQGLAPDASTPTEQQPASHDDGTPSNEPCAICAVMSMANQVVGATPPPLLLPDAVERPLLATGATFAHPGTSWRAFQSRAPPVS